MMQALRYLQANAARLQIDPDRIAIGGDSAGAQIAAQMGALVTAPGYADAVGVTPTITAAQRRGRGARLRSVRPRAARQASTAADRRFISVVLWAYSGKRHFLDDPVFATLSVTNSVTSAFPPAFITVGNVDPLRPHSERLVEKLRAQGVESETLFYPDDYQPPLNHEHQFDLDTDAGQLFLERMLAFLRQRLGAPPQP